MDEGCKICVARDKENDHVIQCVDHDGSKSYFWSTLWMYVWHPIREMKGVRYYTRKYGWDNYLSEFKPCYQSFRQHGCGRARSVVCSTVEIAIALREGWL